VETISTGN